MSRQMLPSNLPTTKKKQVIIKLWGGLGNQMFQYAFGLAVAKAFDMQLKADLSYFESTPSADTIRSYELSAFSLSLKKAQPNELPAKTKSVAEKFMAFIIPKNRFNVIIEKHYYTYDRDLLNNLNSQRSLYLDGYWQCYKYIENLRDDLVSSFCLKKPLSYSSSILESFIKQHNCVALHVRRGDYIGNQGAATLDKHRYYYSACNYLAQLVPDPHFCVFSDDIAWCMEELDLPYNHTFITPDNQTAAADLYLMTLCKHHIIANSTFSWWGAWLANNQSQIVIAPTKWLADYYKNNTVEDLIPSHWLRFDNA